MHRDSKKYSCFQNKCLSIHKMFTISKNVNELPKNIRNINKCSEILIWFPNFKKIFTKFKKYTQTQKNISLKTENVTEFKIIFLKFEKNRK